MSEAVLLSQRGNGSRNTGGPSFSRPYYFLRLFLGFSGFPDFQIWVRKAPKAHQKVEGASLQTSGPWVKENVEKDYIINKKNVIRGAPPKI